ncbi:MAG: hypothetical protein ACRDRY_10355 [Pseudonocardiaceae bacterium]
MAQKLLRNSTCVLCRERPSNAPEHVLKDGFIKQFFPHKDERDENEQYSLRIGGRPELSRDGSIWTQNNFPRVMLPCCEECNGTLNTRFEQPAEAIILRFFSDRSTGLDSNEIHPAGLWLLKTCLLLVHPEARQQARDYIPLPRWNLTAIPSDMYSWMVNDQPPPVGLSVWISRVRDPQPGDPPSQQIALPTVVADGRSTQFQVNQCGIRLLGIDLVYHPGWSIKHPLEADGLAVRIWPHSGSNTVNIVGLPAVSRQAIAWVPGPEARFAPGMYEEASLPPLTAGMDWTLQSVPGVLGVAAVITRARQAR